MNEVLVDVAELLLIDAAVRADEVAGPGVEEHVLKDCLVAPVNVFLRALADVDESESGGRALADHQRVKHERIQSVIVPASLRKLRVILRC